LNFGNEINLGKLVNNKDLEGILAFSSFRYRDSTKDSNPNNFVEAQSMFNPSNWQSGTQFRVLAFGAEIGTKNLLPIKDMVVLRGGWLQPQKEFADQPLSKLFLNNAVNSAKGIGGNIPFSSSFSTWGGTLKVQLHETVYVKNGLFMSFPQATATTNHGLAYQGYGPATNQNGLFYMGETWLHADPRRIQAPRQIRLSVILLRHTCQQNPLMERHERCRPIRLLFPSRSKCSIASPAQLLPPNLAAMANRLSAENPWPVENPSQLQ
jgi:hypothetical protein